MSVVAGLTDSTTATYSFNESNRLLPLAATIVEQTPPKHIKAFAKPMDNVSTTGSPENIRYTTLYQGLVAPKSAAEGYERTSIETPTLLDDSTNFKRSSQKNKSRLQRQLSSFVWSDRSQSVRRSLCRRKARDHS
jgi:hypothetical protein